MMRVLPIIDSLWGHEDGGIHAKAEFAMEEGGP